MRKIKNQANFVYGAKHKIQPSGELMTVPDDSFTISEILEKFTRGVDPMLSRNPLDMPYDAEIDDKVLNFDDLTDIDEAKEYMKFMNDKKTELGIKLKELEKAEKEKEKALAREQLKKEIEEEQKQKPVS